MLFPAIWPWRESKARPAGIFCAIAPPAWGRCFSARWRSGSPPPMGSISPGPPGRRWPRCHPSSPPGRNGSFFSTWPALRASSNSSTTSRSCRSSTARIARSLFSRGSASPSSPACPKCSARNTRFTSRAEAVPGSRTGCRISSATWTTSALSSRCTPISSTMRRPSFCSRRARPGSAAVRRSAPGRPMGSGLKIRICRASSCSLPATSCPTAASRSGAPVFCRVFTRACNAARRANPCSICRAHRE